MARVLVTGIAGMWASAIAEHLVSLGHEVFGVDDLSRGRKEFIPKGLFWMKRDLSEGQPMMTVGVSAIIHCAAHVGGVGFLMQDRWTHLKNAAIDWHVIESCVKTKTPLVYVSSCCVYPEFMHSEVYHLANGGAYKLKETDAGLDNGEPDEGLYGLMKLSGEMAVRAAVEDRGLDAKIVRGFNVYGPHEVPDPKTGHVIPALIGKVLRGQLPLQVWGSGRALRSYLYVEDAARGVVAAMEKGKAGEVYNIGTSESRSVNEIARKVLLACDVPVTEFRNDPSMPEGAYGRLADISKSQKELGWAPTTKFEEGLADTVSWCREWIKHNG